MNIVVFITDRDRNNVVMRESEYCDYNFPNTHRSGMESSLDKVDELVKSVLRPYNVLSETRFIRRDTSTRVIGNECSISTVEMYCCNYGDFEHIILNDGYKLVTCDESLRYLVDNNKYFEATLLLDAVR